MREELGQVIADLTDAKSVLQELQAIVPSSPKLAVQPVIIAAQEEPGQQVDDAANKQGAAEGVEHH